MSSIVFLKQECNWRCRCCHKSKRASLQIWSKADTVIIARDERERYVLTTQSTSKVHKQGNLNILLGGIIILTKSWNKISQCSTSHFCNVKVALFDVTSSAYPPGPWTDHQHKVGRKHEINLFAKIHTYSLR